MIKNISIDPNGLCNAKCWFCPIAYLGNPKDQRANMSIETLDLILKQISEGIGDYISPDGLTAHPTHYNEVLLYPYLEELILTYKKYNIKLMIYSNGTNLTKDKVDIIYKYSDSIERIILNIPSAFKEQWSDFSGFNINMFDKLIDNLNYAYQKLNSFVDSSKISIVVNGVNKKSYSNNNGWTDSLENSKNYNLDIDNGDVAKTVKKFKKDFSGINVYSNIHLEDRGGTLEDLNIISNKNAINLKIKKQNNQVIGCMDNRIEEWVHISAKGDVFICCEDFHFSTSFGNIHEEGLEQIWKGEKRKEMIKKAMSGICTRCSYAKWST